MKNHTTEVLAIITQLLRDATFTWPDFLEPLGKDLSYLREAAEHRGLSFFTITLPEYGKFLDRSLSAGCLVPGIPRGIPMRVGRPGLFQCLLDLVFDGNNMLRLDADVNSVAFLRQLCFCFKKLRLDCTSDKIEETLNEFYLIEDRLPPSHPNTWDSDIPVWTNRYGHPLSDTGEGYVSDISEDLTVLGEPSKGYSWHPNWDDFRKFCACVISQFGEPDWWLLKPKHGPGAVAETGFNSKYEFGHWPTKLGLFFPFDWFGSGQLDHDSEQMPSDREPPSVLHAVPKSQKGPRLICAEPISHQWMQQSIWRWLEGRMSSTLLAESVTFRSQEKSRSRALSASLSGTMATVDLSSASDRISTRLVEYIFQGSPLLDGFHAVRTRYLSQNISSKFPKEHLLRKFSTQGSALTFPVETIVFTIIAVWALRVADGKFCSYDRKDLKKSFRQVTVFGDDIILPVRAYENLVTILTTLGLKVNPDKSFHEGNFRESCGVDAFRGHDVTPAYFLEAYDGTAASLATTVEVSNNFHKKGYWNTASAVSHGLPEKELKLLRIVGKDDGNFGLFSTVGTETLHLKRGYYEPYQREYSVSLTVTSKVTKKRGRGSADLTQYFFESPDPLVKWSAGGVGRVRVSKQRTRVFD